MIDILIWHTSAYNGTSKPLLGQARQFETELVNFGATFTLYADKHLGDVRVW